MIQHPDPVELFKTKHDRLLKFRRKDETMYEFVQEAIHDPRRNRVDSPNAQSRVLTCN